MSTHKYPSDEVTMGVRKTYYSLNRPHKYTGVPQHLPFDDPLLIQARKKYYKYNLSHTMCLFRQILVERGSTIDEYF